MMFQEDLNSSCNGIRIGLENAFTTCVWNQGSFQSTTLRRPYNELKKMFECNVLQKLIVFYFFFPEEWPSMPNNGCFYED